MISSSPIRIRRFYYIHAEILQMMNHKTVAIVPPPMDELYISRFAEVPVYRCLFGGGGRAGGTAEGKQSRIYGGYYNRTE
jgi:hypothetical protein